MGIPDLAILHSKYVKNILNNCMFYILKICMYIILYVMLPWTTKTIYSERVCNKFEHHLSCKVVHLEKYLNVRLICYCMFNSINCLCIRIIMLYTYLYFYTLKENFF